MVRGRRVRAVVTVSNSEDCCSPNPKRKDRIVISSDKHAIITSKSKAQTITQFFQSVTVEDAETNLEEELIRENDISPADEAHITTRRNGSPIKSKIQNGNIHENGITKVGTPILKSLDERLKSLENGITNTPPTPHRIELCQEIEEFKPKKQPTRLTYSPKRFAIPPKARRKAINNKHITKAPVINENVNENNQKLTDFFPVRRSERKTKKTVLEEQQRSLEQILRENKEEGLEIHSFDGKGRGVVAAREFYKGDFVVEYSGELIDIPEAKRRELLYAQDKSTGCYMYYFKYNGQQYCIDATAESGKLGRLVNHSRNGNLVTRTISVDKQPRLILIAKDNIRAGEEVTYDYGDRSKESLKHHPWLAF